MLCHPICNWLYFFSPNCVVVFTEYLNSNYFQYQWIGKPNKILKSKCPQKIFFCAKKCAAGKFFLWKECAAGKMFFLTESWWVLCDVDVICKSLFNHHRSESSFFDQWMNYWINLWMNYTCINLGPDQSTFVCPTGHITHIDESFHTYACLLVGHIWMRPVTHVLSSNEEHLKEQLLPRSHIKRGNVEQRQSSVFMNTKTGEYCEQIFRSRSIV